MGDIGMTRVEPSGEKKSIGARGILSGGAHLDPNNATAYLNGTGEADMEAKMNGKGYRYVTDLTMDGAVAADSSGRKPIKQFDMKASPGRFEAVRD